MSKLEEDGGILEGVSVPEKEKQAKNQSMKRKIFRSTKVGI